MEIWTSGVRWEGPDTPERRLHFDRHQYTSAQTGVEMFCNKLNFTETSSSSYLKKEAISVIVMT